MAKPPKQPSKLSLILRAVIWGILFIVVIVAVITFVVYRDEIDSKSLSRLLPSFRLPGDGEVAEADSFSFDPMDDNQFAVSPSGGLFVLNNKSLALSDAAGRPLTVRNTGFTYPALSVSRRGILAYDRGGTTLYLLNDREVVLEKTYERPIRSARINDRGSFAVVAEEPGFKAAAEVYNFNGDMLFRVLSSSQNFTDAVLSPDGSRMAAASFLQVDTRFFSRVTFFDITSEETNGYAQAEFPDELVYSVYYPNKNYVVVLLQSGIEFFKSDGTFIKRCPFGDKMLLDAAIQGEGFAAVRLGRYRSGIRNEIVMFSLEGEELMRTEIRDPVLAMSSGGNYLSVLVTGVISMYDSTGTFVGSAETGDTRIILQNGDGGVISIGHGKAARVKPE